MQGERVNFLRGQLGKQVHVVVDRPVGYVHGEIKYPINYGYILGVMAGDGEEQDVYILGIEEPLTEFDGKVIGGILRLDDCEDKLVVAPEGMEFHQAQIVEMVHFQEQFFNSRVISAFEKSCGVLPYRMVDGEMEFLLVFEEFSQCWSLPKGHMEPGETEIQTALRELQEETGMTARIESSKHASIEYPISPVARKCVVFYLGEADGLPRCRAGEIQRCRWVRREELEQYLFPDTVQVCLRLLDQGG